MTRTRVPEGAMVPLKQPRAVADGDENEFVLPATPSDLTPGLVVRWAVMSLYLDQALPRGPLLQWVLQLLVGVRFTHRQLRTFLEEAPGVFTDPPTFKKFNFCARLLQPPPGFTFFESEEDVSETLDQDVWDEVAACLAGGGWPKAEDPSYKYYVVASWLQDVSSTLSRFSFGRLLSIVRSSAQSVGLLGHRGGLLVPYALSEECERRVNAFTCQPTAVAPNERYVKTWTELKDCLHQLLQKQADKTIEVSKVKATFRTVFARELSETVFGHRCLSKLLMDDELGQEFSMDTVSGNRYVLRLATKGGMDCPTPVEPGAVKKTWSAKPKSWALLAPQLQ